MLEKLQLMIENKAAVWTVAFITSGLGINIILRLINKIPLEKIYAIIEETAKTVSRMGNLKFTQPLWEPIETFIQKALTGSLEAVNRGFDSDDNQKTEEVKNEKVA